MIGICLIAPEQGLPHEVDQWVYLSWGLAPDGVWATDDAFGRTGLETVASLADLPAADIVIVQPLSGKHVQGTEPLGPYSHPDSAIYVFGASNYNMTTDDISGVAIHSKVYIPGEIDFHAPIAGAMVLYDRVSKV